MSRVTFAEGEDFPNQSLLWSANQERSIKGRKGQAALRDLESALLALPEKRLIQGELENPGGGVCAIGALAKFKGKENPQIGDVFDEYGTTIIAEDIERFSVQFAAGLGVPELVAIAVVAENDDSYPPQTPEQRYERMLRWTRRQLVDPPTEEAKNGQA